jgi:hypothetical protein
LFEKLDLADVYLYNISKLSIITSSTTRVRSHILERVDALGGLLDLSTNDFWDQFRCELSECAGRCFTLNDIHHLLPDSPNLGGLGVCGLLDLVVASLSESYREKAKKIVIGSLDSDVGLDQGLPLAD